MSPAAATLPFWGWCDGKSFGNPSSLEPPSPNALDVVVKMKIVNRTGLNKVLGCLALTACLGAVPLFPALDSNPARGDEPIAENLEPELHSLLPMGGTRESKFDVKVIGTALAGSYAAWFEGSGGLKANVAASPESGSEVSLHVTVDSNARLGPHPLRLVTPRGVSNPIYLHVHAEPTISEAELAVQSGNLRRAQKVAFPAIVNGSITRQGERDLYAFDAKRGEALAFQVILSRESLKKGFRPQLRLYDPTGSWFDPHKLSVLAFHSEVIESDTPISSPLIYRFRKAGRYLVELVSERHKGAPDYAYQLRIVSSAAPYRSYAGPTATVARSFMRRLTTDRLSYLWSRAVAPDEPSRSQSKSVNASVEQEPNDDLDQAMQLTVPTLIEGAIAKPGDIDRFTFRVEPNQRLAFEIETWGVTPPHFNPRLEITDSVGRSLLTNIHRVNMPKSGRWDLKRLEAKIIQGFEQGGEYRLEVRDVTSRAGHPEYRYRLLIRPQVPHIGQLEIATLKRGFEDQRIDPLRINLMPGEAKTLTVETYIEELASDVVEGGGTRRFTSGAGELALIVEDLPPGVRAFPGGFVENTRDDDMQTVKAYHLLPDTHKATIVLEADPDAPATRMPQVIRVVARSLIQGRPGRRILGGGLPVMVAQPQPERPPEVVAGDASARTEEVVAPGPTATRIAKDLDQPPVRVPTDAAVKTDAQTPAKVRAVDVAPGQQAEVRSLRLVPARLHLSGSGASRRFLVLAQMTDGLQRDVTAEARYAISRRGVVDVEDGKATGVADGDVELRAEFSGKTVTAQVFVERTSVTRPFSFARDIGGILTKHGCNSQKCHGSVKGKGGFKLSINAVFPQKDFRWIVEGGTYHVMTPEGGEAPPISRIDLTDPQKSPLLLKATGAVSHGGERRLTRGDKAYAVLERWIKSGAPYGTGDAPDAVQIKSIEVFPREVVLGPAAAHRLLVTAHLSNGQQDDLTDDVRFESNNREVVQVTRGGLVTAQHAGETNIIIRAAGHATSARIGVVAQPLAVYPPQETRNFIDEQVFTKLRRFHILPSPSSTDAEFLRRVCLDATGTLPPPSRVREFLRNDEPDKRDKLVEILLESPEYVDFWTYRFSELFRVYSGATLNVEHAQLHENWIRTNVARNKPYDQVARERIAAQGYNSPAWHYWTFRELTPAPDVTTEQFRVFMGRRLGCAQCHDHPFENWGQDQFWGIAAFFGNMTRIVEVAGMRGPYFVIDDPAGHGFRKVGRGKLLHPRTKQEVQPAFLDGSLLSADQRIDLRMRLAEWMTAPANPFFAETIVNRVWAYFFGRGIVHPVDDFRSSNPPSHPDLLAALATDFVEHKYDLKHLIRTILHSRVYQLSGEPNATNERDEVNFSRAYPRLLDPPVLLDAISQVTGIDSELVVTGAADATAGVPPGMRAISVLPNDVPCTFFDAFNRNDRRGVPEDKPQLTVLRSLHRLVGSTYSKGFVGRGGHLDKLLDRKLTDREIIEEFYLSASSRFPTDHEQAALQRLIAEQPARQVGLESLIWALLNAREFVYNH